MDSEKVRLLLPEYGRNVQKMVKFLKTLEDRDLRNRQAQVVVGIMGNLYPGRRDTEDFQHMLWDHLFMIAEFDLDIDSPFPKPDPSMFFQTPQRVPYTQSQDGDRSWGRYLPKMIKSVVEKEGASEEDKETIALNIANFTKQKSREFNSEASMNSSIAKDIERLSGGKLHVEAESISEFRGGNDKQKKPGFKQGGKFLKQKNKKSR